MDDLGDIPTEQPRQMYKLDKEVHKDKRTDLKNADAQPDKPSLLDYLKHPSTLLSPGSFMRGRANSDYEKDTRIKKPHSFADMHGVDRFGEPVAFPEDDEAITVSAFHKLHHPDPVLRDLHAHRDAEKRRSATATGTGHPAERQAQSSGLLKALRDMHIPHLPAIHSNIDPSNPGVDRVVEAFHTLDNEEHGLDFEDFMKDRIREASSDAPLNTSRVSKSDLPTVRPSPYSSDVVVDTRKDVDFAQMSPDSQKRSMFQKLKDKFSNKGAGDEANPTRGDSLLSLPTAKTATPAPKDVREHPENYKHLIGAGAYQDSLVHNDAIGKSWSRDFHPGGSQVAAYRSDGYDSVTSGVGAGESVTEIMQGVAKSKANRTEPPKSEELKREEARLNKFDNPMGDVGDRNRRFDSSSKT